MVVIRSPQSPNAEFYVENSGWSSSIWVVGTLFWSFAQWWWCSSVLLPEKKGNHVLYLISAVPVLVPNLQLSLC